MDCYSASCPLPGRLGKGAGSKQRAPASTHLHLLRSFWLTVEYKGESKATDLELQAAHPKPLLWPLATDVAGGAGRRGGYGEATLSTEGKHFCFPAPSLFSPSCGCNHWVSPQLVGSLSPAIQDHKQRRLPPLSPSLRPWLREALWRGREGQSWSQEEGELGTWRLVRG